MSSTLDNFSGKIILVATLFAKPGKGDELQKHLADLAKYCNSPEEPGCLTYRTSRAGDTFNVYEEYADKAAVAAHRATEKFKGLMAVAADLSSGPPSVQFFEEF